VCSLDPEARGVAVEREAADERSRRPPSIADVEYLILTALAGSPPIADEERQRQLGDLMPKITDALRHNGLAKRMKIEALEPVLAQLYKFTDRLQLQRDLQALRKPDETAAIDKRIATLEKKAEKIKTQLAEHRQSVLKCFRNGHIDQRSLVGGCAYLANVPWDQERIAIELLKKFATDWRQRARLFLEPVSVHGVSIASMRPDRREAWQKAYEAMQLDSQPRTVRYVARIEAREPAERATNQPAFVAGKTACAR
jgi:hypothetical protein